MTGHASPTLRSRALQAALAARPPGRAARPAPPIDGADAFRRAAAALDELLTSLTDEEWSRPALRGLDVQGLVGHLIGVETAFGGSLTGVGPQPGVAEHVTATQPAALAQAGRPPTETHREWRQLVERSVALVADVADLREPKTWFGITLPLDELLVIRSFELWIHDEDIRRATGRPPRSPDPSRLARMTDLAMQLLAQAPSSDARTPATPTARVVLTGPGGGTWQLPATASTTKPRRPTRLVVDAATFCRIVGNRTSLADGDAVVTGDRDAAEQLCQAAAALALD
ncbi:MAG TPA: maleylpyruvate isomerase family mycothiol-dependent enzyme [Mycobacteriales bacterium]|nr:maleylpyruvate isomerase family mycothiol-dependent enzyme [Mycobacteriales bacterium]